MSSSRTSKQCKHPTCGELCRRIKVVKKRKPIAKFSKKRITVNGQYSIDSRVFRALNPFCAIKSPVCTHRTQGVHHLKGKATIELLMNKKWWLSACNPCNDYVEANSAWAYENGFKLSKFN